jgi:hypothetical protein
MSILPLLQAEKEKRKRAGKKVNFFRNQVLLIQASRMQILHELASFQALPRAQSVMALAKLEKAIYAIIREFESQGMLASASAIRARLLPLIPRREQCPD